MKISEYFWCASLFFSMLAPPIQSISLFIVAVVLAACAVLVGNSEHKKEMSEIDKRLGNDR
jgi:hypothetical protein